MIQLTAWVALTDSTIENGALRVVPGTFVDGRLEHLYDYASDHLLDFLAGVPADRLEDFLRVALFSTGSFFKAQALFELTAWRFADTLQGRQVRDLHMEAGEAIIFTSLNMHASFPNRTSNDTRLAFVGRYTNGDVRVLPHLTHDFFPTPEGDVPFPIASLACIQVHGEDRHHHNHVVTTCGDPSALPSTASQGNRPGPRGYLSSGRSSGATSSSMDRATPG
jgi:non-haem Fe2+, alpha-ketoglutarate-dependent halogenase